VKSGDAWPYIARKLGVSLDALLAANGATAKQPLYPGDKLVIPAKEASTTAAGGANSSVAGGAGTSVAASGSTYTVKAGDYWIGIAKKLGVSLNALLSANGATYSTPLNPGSKINIPAKG
jgi:LysM repeat protein